MKLNVEQKINAAVITIFLVVSTCTYVSSKTGNAVKYERYANPIVSSDSTFAVFTPEP